MDATTVERVRDVLERSAAVRLAYLFGSIARGDDRDDSDVDLAVLLDDRSCRDRLQEELEAAAGRDVDLLLLEGAPPLLLAEVLREGSVLVRRDEDERAEFELRARAIVFDTEHLRAVQRGYLRERAESRRGARAK